MRVIYPVAALAILLGIGGCGRPTTASHGRERPMVSLEFLTRHGCVNTPVMKANLEKALRELGRKGEYRIVRADRLPEADVRRGYGTPTILLDGKDMFGRPVPTTAAGLG